jgi:glycosyltransferase involved in cell wall biosynthesis
MNSKPLISFCIATYKRPEILKETISAILNQKYPNLEIIVADDDPKQSAKKTVDNFNSKRIFYLPQKKNMGMVDTFNNAFKHSKGDFVTIMTDDDPPTKDMLEIFIKTLKKYPKIKAFWGGSYADIKTGKLADVTHLEQGYNSLVNKSKKYGFTEVLKPMLFFKQFFKQEIFPHYLWNASLISRDLVKEISGVPNYDSPHFIDYAYLLKIAAKTDFVIINNELAISSIHENNYGKTRYNIEEYKRGVIGFDKTISPLATKFGCKKEYQKFLSDYIIMFLINRLEYYRKFKFDINAKMLFDSYSDLSKSVTFLKERETEVYLKLNYYFLFQKINFIRKTYGNIKLKLIANKKST